MVSEGQIKLTTQKKKRIYKKGPLKKRDIQGMTLYIAEGATCDCQALDGETDWTNSKTNFLAMGRKVDGLMMIDFLQIYDRRNKDTRRAMRSIRKVDDICASGIRALTTDEHKRKKDKKDKRRKGRKGKKGKRKRDRKRKRSKNQESSPAKQQYYF